MKLNLRFEKKKKIVCNLWFPLSLCASIFLNSIVVISSFAVLFPKLRKFSQCILYNELIFRLKRQLIIIGVLLLLIFHLDFE